ncbi:radical SAM protein [Flavobacterium dauae]|uniref:radical SAM protein n=1 Tax=Flavobacterium dauae TaxID=1563479 RepID=UPI001F16CAB3|nr:radical SAM protein [Flavobacterium dauae]WLD23306.1 radical SAM protein [Flavobacterium dauae]
MGDESYIHQPKFISIENIQNLTDRIKEHCNRHDLKKFGITFHGGEPLLYGKAKMIKIIEILKSIENDNLNIAIGIQTNGILIDNDWCEIFKKYKIQIGISLDGVEKINDENRIDFKGKGTYDRVIEGVKKCQEYNINFGVLSVVNITQPPTDTIEHFKKLKIKGFDLLLLDQNHDSKVFEKFKVSDWLIELFDLWYPQAKDVSINLFANIIYGIYGLDIKSDAIGKNINKTIIIETDGSIETLDVLKICGNNFTKNNLNIRNNQLDDVFDSDLIKLYYYSNTYLPKKCLACPIQNICGGGYIPHRYSSSAGFNNPTIYCDDILKLVTHIQNILIDEMNHEIKEKSKVEKLSYERAIQIIDQNINTITTPNYVEFLEGFRKNEYA